MFELDNQMNVGVVMSARMRVMLNPRYIEHLGNGARILCTAVCHKMSVYSVELDKADINDLGEVQDLLWSLRKFLFDTFSVMDRAYKVSFENRTDRDPNFILEREGYLIAKGLIISVYEAALGKYFAIGGKCSGLFFGRDALELELD